MLKNTNLSTVCKLNIQTQKERSLEERGLLNSVVCKTEVRIEKKHASILRFGRMLSIIINGMPVSY